MSDITAQKKCNRCSTVYPATLEYFNRNGDSPDGLYSLCKPCRAVVRRRYHQSLFEPENQEKLLRMKQEQRIRDQKLRKNHPERVRENIRRWWANHPEKRLEKGRRWREANRQKCRAAVKRWESKNPERLSQIHRLKHLRRRAAGEFTREQVRELHTLQMDCCAYCQQPLNGKFHIDHIRPVSKGGLSDIGNLCLACPRCNLQKHDKTPLEWIHRWYQQESGKTSPDED